MGTSYQTRAWFKPFSHREVEILALISDGLSNHEISQKLLLSLETIKWYNKQIFGKLGVKSRTQAVRIATDFGLLYSPGTEAGEKESPSSSNLPSQLSSFVGRAREIVEIKGLLKASRLVVLTGPGGCGKSRLAAQAGAELIEAYPDGVWLVEFASISDPALVLNALIQVLQINTSSNTSLLDLLKRYLGRKHLLLLLDNMEHLPDAYPLVGELLAAAPQVSVLATSRERLHLYGEQEYPVRPLSLPDLQVKETRDQLLTYEAIDLFVQRARAVQPRFTADEAQISVIANICVRLDGLPLAIELAASHVKIYPPALLAQRLENRLDALPGGSRDLPARQRTLRATLDWSYDLLKEDEKKLFARLAVFWGGSTLEGILSICSHGLTRDAMDSLSDLVEKNLVYTSQGTDGELRFTMLETIHEYATERLNASAEAEDIRILHADYFTRLAEAAEKEMLGAGQGYWFARLRAEQDNLRSVITWSFIGNENEHGLRLTASLHIFWYYNGLAAEGRRWTDLGLARSANATPALRAGVLVSAGRIAYILSDLNKGKEYLHQALDLYQQSGDESGIAWSMAFLGGNYMEDPLEYSQGVTLVKQAIELFRKLKDKPGMALASGMMGELARVQGDYEAAQRYYNESLSIAIETGERQREAILLNNMSFIAYHQQNYRHALHLSQRSLLVAREINSEFRQACFLATIGGPLVALGQSERAAQLIGASQTRYEVLGIRHQPADQPEIDRFEAAARNHLGEKAFQQAWQAGQALTLQEAVSLALTEDLGE